MSRHVIEFAGGRLDLELAEEAFVGAFAPPAGLAVGNQEAALREALERPTNYPPLRQVVVPGDRVAIALDAEIADPRLILDVVADVLQSAGVPPEDLMIVDMPGRVGAFPAGLRGTVEVHDPSNRDRLAYLAATTSGARVYLNRTLTDADVVIPIGLIHQDSTAGPHGPWSVVYPGMSDEAAREARSADASGRDPAVEAAEVGWLLGAHFQIGVAPGSNGPAGFVAGLAEDVRKAGEAIIDRDWTFRPEARAELVVAGIGGGDGPAGLHELIAGLATAGGLVARGGKIVALSRAEGRFGPALQRLSSAEDVSDFRNILRGHEADPDYLLARTLTQVLAWADVYLLSGLAPDDVEALSMIPLDRPEEGGRLAGRAASCLVLSRAEQVRAEVRDRDEP